jgi:L-aspartate oxidase
MDIHFTDVLILGSGAAGIRAAVAARQAGADLLLVTSGNIIDHGSTFSEISRGWGFQALPESERTEKNLESFFEDIARVGLGEHNPKLARILVEESGQRLKDLISYGVTFKKMSDGKFLRAKGCFSDCERAFITADFDNLQHAFLSILKQLSVRIVTGYAVDLIISDGGCWGARILTTSGRIVRIIAKATVLATGGGAGIYRHHLVHDAQIGDGYALAHAAGAELANMEFVQFMLGLKHNGQRQFLPLSELSRPKIIQDSKGADLLDDFFPDSGSRDKAIKERQTHLPFSCRDVSSQIDVAIANSLISRREVYWQKNGSNAQKPNVVHFAHAFNGGVVINEFGETTIAGLYAAGEVAAGPHGADRIGGCMMTATQVFGQRAGRFASKRAKMIKQFPEVDRSEIPAAIGTRGGTEDDVLYALQALEYRVREAMGGYATVLRNHKGLTKCLEILNKCRQHLHALGFIGLAGMKRYFKVCHMIITADLVVSNALARKESKGPHFRDDDSLN